MIDHKTHHHFLGDTFALTETNKTKKKKKNLFWPVNKSTLPENVKHEKLESVNYRLPTVFGDFIHMS